MEGTERGSLGGGVWDSKREREQIANPSAREASDGLELQCTLSRRSGISRGTREEDSAAPSSLGDAGWRKNAYVSGGVGHGSNQSRDIGRKKNAGRTQGQRCWLEGAPGGQHRILTHRTPPQLNKGSGGGGQSQSPG